MLRLRTTLILSLLGLAVGIVGTDWLSARSTDEPLAMPLVVAKRSESPRHRRVSSVSPAYASREASLRRRPWINETAGVTPRVQTFTNIAPITPAPELVPISMPISRDLTYAQLRDHLDGRVVLRVSIDGNGHVTAASVAQSSGDAVLDAHALRSVHGWHFVVPPDHPDGLSANLRMDFSSSRQPVASVR